MILLHTLMQDGREAWHGEALRSVPRGVMHLITTGNEFLRTRWLAMTMAGEMVGFLDDDDYLIGDPIEACARALRETGAGVAFTWDRTIEEGGATLRDNTSRTSYEAITQAPYAIRQFSLVRRSCITDAALRLACDVGPHVIDLALKAQVAFDHGAVQVPMIGYARRRHPGGMSRNGFAEQWTAAAPTLQRWYDASSRRGAVPVYGSA